MPITRRHFLATSTAAIAATTSARLTLFGQQPPAPVTPLFKELRHNTGYWTARGGTIGWLINPAGVVAVDSQFPDTAALCVDQLLKTSGKTEIATLINTHHHGDHTGGNGVFRPKTKQIVGHANVPKYLKAGFDQAVAKRAEQNPAPTTPAPTEPVVPDRTLTDALTVDHGDEKVSEVTVAGSPRAAIRYLPASSSTPDIRSRAPTWRRDQDSCSRCVARTRCPTASPA